MSDPSHAFFSDKQACRQALATWIENYAESTTRQPQPPFWFSLLGNYECSLIRQMKLDPEDFTALLVTAGLVTRKEREKLWVSEQVWNDFFNEFLLGIRHKNVCEITDQKVNLNKLRRIEKDEDGDKLKPERKKTWFLRLGTPQKKTYCICICFRFFDDTYWKVRWCTHKCLFQWLCILHIAYYSSNHYPCEPTLWLYAMLRAADGLRGCKVCSHHLSSWQLFHSLLKFTSMRSPFINKVLSNHKRTVCIIQP